MFSASNVTSKSFPSFISSGEVTDEELNKYKEIIKSLGGRFLTCKNDQFISSCTHIICFGFFSSVKIMGGLASGKWLVLKEYVDKSYVAGKWLEEEEFEVKNYKNVAKFLRLRKRKLYDGSIFYVEGENTAHTKSLIRVLVAGGAILVNKSDILEKKLKIECAITDLKNLQSVQALVGETTPILKLDYIKETIIFKHDPGDKEKFLLNPQTARNLLKLGNLSSIARGEEDGSFINKFCKPIVNPASTPSKSRIRRRTTAMTVPGKCHNIASYFLKKELSQAFSAGTKKTKFDYSANNSEIEIIKEVKIQQRDPDCFIIESPSRVVKQINFGEEDKEINNQSKRPNKSLQKPKEEPGTVGNNLAPEHCVSAMGISSLSIAGPLESDNRNNSISTICNNRPPDTHFTSRVEPQKNILQEVKENVNRPKNNSVTESLFDSQPSLKSDLDENMEKERQLATFNHNKKRLIESKSATIVIDFERIKSIIQTYIILLNTSHHYISSNHIPTYPYPSMGKAVNELVSQNSLYIGNAVEDDIHIASKRLGRYRVDRIERKAEERDASGDHADERLIALVSLEWLQLSVQPDVIPNHVALGVMIKYHIMRTIFRDVSDRALSIFLCVVNIHPPENKKMRDYYMNVFQKASTDSETLQPSYKLWTFLRIVVKDLIGTEARYDAQTTLDYVVKLLELDLICYNESPVNWTSLLCYRAFWVGMHQNPSVMNDAVKELLQLWVQTARASPLVRKKVTKLVCIMFEIIWKCDAGNPYLLTKWPLKSVWMAIAHEIICQFKELDDSRSVLRLVEELTVPWHQMLLASLALRSLRPANDTLVLSLSSLKSAIMEEVKCCTRGSKGSKKGKDDEDAPFPHSVRIRLLILLLVSYTHTTGVKYCRSVLTSQFQRTLRKSNGVHTHAQKKTSNSATEEQDSGSDGNASGSSGDRSSNEGSSSRDRPEKSKGKRKLDETPSSSPQRERGESSTDGSLQSPLEEGSEEVLREMARETMNNFRLMQPTIEELALVKRRCSHINYNFCQAL